MLSRFTHKFHSLRDKYILDIPPRAANPYLTHLPILLTAAQWRPLTAVLEFGSGEISTQTFLDRTCFPELVRLESYENDPQWAQCIKNHVGDDTRLHLHMVQGEMASAVNEVDLEAFDLIFIDDSTTAQLRSATIRAVATKQPQRAIVVIHDFECLAYRRAAHLFRHSFRFVGQNPNTGVAWNGNQLSRSQLQSLDRRLRRIGEKGDTVSWVAAIHSDCAQ